MEGSEKSELINEVGSVLALLANQKGGILLPQLLKSYQSETGKVFPLRKMGYINPAEAIEAMGEHVKIVQDKCSGVKGILSIEQYENMSSSNHNRVPLRTIQPPSEDNKKAQSQNKSNVDPTIRTKLDEPSFPKAPHRNILSIDTSVPPPQNHAFSPMSPSVSSTINQSIPPPINQSIPPPMNPSAPPMNPSVPPPMNRSVPPMNPSVPPPRPLNPSGQVGMKASVPAPMNRSIPPPREKFRSNLPVNHERPPILAPLNPQLPPPNLQISSQAKTFENHSPNDQKGLVPENEPKGDKIKKKKRKKKSLMVPQRMTYQLTFVNQYQLSKLEIVDAFEKFGELVRVSVFSGIKRRCFIHYTNEENAIAALEALKDDDQFFDLEIADACKKEPSESDNEDESSEEEEETKTPIDMVIHRGTYQLSFSTENYVRLEAIQDLFEQYGKVSGVDCNMRRVKGRARVFVKFFEKTSALLAYANLKDQFEDLEVAKSCVKPEEDSKEIVPVGPDGKYCLRFRNFGPGNGLFANWEVRDMFSQFGDVWNVKQDTMQWCYIRFNQQQEAQAAFDEYKHSTILESFGIAKWRDEQDEKNEEEEQSDMELFIGNYPHAMTLKNLRRLFRDHQHKLQFRRMRVNGQKAYCFAKVNSIEEMKEVIRDLNGFEIRKDRKLIVRAKIQEMHEAIEEELKAEAEEGRMRAQDMVHKIWSDTAPSSNYVKTEVKVVIAGYPEETTERELWQLLDPYDPVKVVMGFPEEEFTYSHVIFDNMVSAERAVNELDGAAVGSTQHIVVEFVDDAEDDSCSED